MRALEIEQENAEIDVLQYLTENNELETAAHGIALQVLAKGMDSLTPKQQYVYDRYIRHKYFRMECEACHIPMPTNEVVVALAEIDRLCGHCRNARGKYF